MRELQTRPRVRIGNAILVRIAGGFQIVRNDGVQLNDGDKFRTR
jgi:hypothetical protein